MKQKTLTVTQRHDIGCCRTASIVFKEVGSKKDDPNSIYVYDCSVEDKFVVDFVEGARFKLCFRHIGNRITHIESMKVCIMNFTIGVGIKKSDDL